MGRKETVEAIQKQITEGEAYQGAFSGITRPGFGLSFLIGPLSSLLTKVYVIGVTDKKLYFAKENLLGHLEALDSFDDSEISKLTMKKNMLAGYTFHFEFNNGRKLKLLVHFREEANAASFLTRELLTLLQVRFQCFS
jgi:hypothetical protein